MCVGQYSYLRVVVCCGDYILHLGENIVYTFFGCCTYYYNLPSLVQRELAPKVTEGLFFVAFCFYNPSASHSLGTSLYTREGRL